MTSSEKKLTKERDALQRLAVAQLGKIERQAAEIARLRRLVERLQAETGKGANDPLSRVQTH